LIGLTGGSKIHRIRYGKVPTHSVIREADQSVHRMLDGVNRLGITLASATPGMDIRELMVRSIKEITGAVGVVLSDYIPSTGELEVRSLTFDGAVLSRAESLMGSRIVGFRMKVDPRYHSEMLSDVGAVSDSLYETTFRTIPKPVARMLQNALGLKTFVAAAFRYEGELRGTVSLILGKDSPPIHYEVLGVIRAIGSQALYRRSMEERLRSTEKKYEELFMNSTDALYTADLEGNLLEFNPALVKVFGHPQERLRAMNLGDHHVVKTERVRFIEELKGRGELVDHEVMVRRADGRIRTCLVSARVRRSQDGRVVGYQGTLRDVTDNRRLREDLRREKLRAELYLDLLGHDIGNIHQGVSNSVSLALEKKDDPRFVEMALRPSKELLSRSVDLVKNVKLISKLRKSQLDVEDVDLVDMARRTIEEMKAIFGTWDLDIGMTSSSERITAQLEPISREVMFNLVHNAVKFQRGMRVWVRIDVSERTHEGRQIVTIKVSDSGPGMGEAVKAMVSDMSGIVSREHSGLGLSIVKELIDRYCGTITVRDRVPGSPGEGTVVEVSFFKTLPPECVESSEECYSLSTCHSPST